MTFVRVETDGGIRVLTLTRPEKLNALTTAGAEELLAALRAAGADDAIRVVVLLGEGRAFCAGADVGGELGDTDLARAARFLTVLADVLREISAMPKPVVAGIQGHACGGGAEIALEADLRVAAEDATVWFPDVGIGSTPASLYMLYRQVGRARTAAMAYLGERLEATELLARGVVACVVPGERVREEAVALARRLAERNAMSLRLAKEALRAADEATREVDLRANISSMLVCYAGDAQARAVQAFGHHG